MSSDWLRRDSLRQGTRGTAWDMALDVREFDIRLDEICIPLRLFYGERDITAPTARVRRVVAVLPTARLTTYEHGAHRSTLCNRCEEIAHVLAGEPLAGEKAGLRIV
ncbi:MAG: hypothetical protein SGJ01_10390 [Gemmatimonadota bacterium]|nr:hypothetical protein [Gemmatimonadota bacterium]MDZ4863841.1 hypothetical protein [Gemmatimonadota bacterium]